MLNTQSKSSAFINRFFNLSENNTSLKTELFAGLTTFLTMVYIIFVNPQILSGAGIDSGAAFVATCISAALGCILMGCFANFPIAVAPGMGLNAYFTYTVVLSMGYSWHTALTMVFTSGILFLVLTLTSIRQKIIAAIPNSITIGIAVGIGLFLAIISLHQVGVITNSQETLVKLGAMNSSAVALFFLGFILMIVLSHFNILGSIVISILLITCISLLLGLTHFVGVFSLPPSIRPSLFSLDLHQFWSHKTLTLVFSFFLVALFDGTGTLMGVMQGTGLKQDPQRLNKLSKALFADSLGIIAGALLGTSNTTPYIESAAGVKAGGKTGLTAITVAILFLICLFISPLAKAIPNFATAPALLFVACLMMQNIADMEWENMTDFVPGIITAIMIPYTFSIATGVGFGILSYFLIHLFTGKFEKLNFILCIFSIIFIGYFVTL